MILDSIAFRAPKQSRHISASRPVQGNRFATRNYSAAPVALSDQLLDFRLAGHWLSLANSVARFRRDGMISVRDLAQPPGKGTSSHHRANMANSSSYCVRHGTPQELKPEMEGEM